MAKIHYEADGSVPAERFIAALTDFSDRRPELRRAAATSQSTSSGSPAAHVACSSE